MGISAILAIPMNPPFAFGAMWPPAGGGREAARQSSKSGEPPDGKLLAFASDRSGEGNLDIWLQQVGKTEAIRLATDPADDQEPSFSPDGTRIVFRSERGGGGTSVVSALGGTETKIAALGTADGSHGWNPRRS
jgi:Tol biopolymer transport system component